MIEEESAIEFLQEEYAKLRKQVHNAYEQCEAIAFQIRLDEKSLDQIRSKRFLFFPVNRKQIKEINNRIYENKVLLKSITGFLPFLADKMSDLEDQLGDKDELFGCDDG